MSVLNNGIRSWWLEKPLSHNMPTDVVFEQFKPTNHNGRDREWIRVISLDDLHSKINMNITRWVDICNQLSERNKEIESLKAEISIYKANERLMQMRLDDLKEANKVLRKDLEWAIDELDGFTVNGDCPYYLENIKSIKDKWFKGETK